MTSVGSPVPSDRVVARPAVTVTVGVVTLLAYLAFAAYATVNGRIWIDEMSYLVKSWWYTTGLVRPYSDDDATWYMPLYFYQLGLAQNVIALGHIVGRTMSVMFGAASAVLVFLICRRITKNDFVAAAAVAIYLLTPTTAYYFATATPIATVAFLNTLAVYLVLVSIDRPPQRLMSVALGVLFAVLFFYRQNMILVIVVLAPTYIYVIGRERWLHAALVAAAAGLFTGGMLMLFPERMGFYAIRLPLLTPILQALSLLPETLRVVQEGTETPYSLGLDPARLSWRDPVNGFLLPYLGTILLTVGTAILGFRRRPRLLLLPAFFLFLAITHYLGSAGYCPACILTYTNYFISVGIAAAAIFLNFVSHRRATLLAAGAIMLNIFGTTLSVPDVAGVASPYRYFPFLLVHKTGPLTDLEETERLARIITLTTPPRSRLLVLHENTSMVFAAFRAGRAFPVQNLNLWQSYRQLRPGQAGIDGATANRILEAESYWSDDTLRRWLAWDVDAVVIQDGITRLPAFTQSEIDANFIHKANAIFMGNPVRIYLRKDLVGN